MKTFEVKTDIMRPTRVEAKHFHISKDSIAFYNDDELVNSFKLYNKNSLEYVKEVTA